MINTDSETSVYSFSVEDVYKRQVALKVCGTDTVPYQGNEIEIGKPWKRMTMKEAVKEYTGPVSYTHLDVYKRQE